MVPVWLAQRKAAQRHLTKHRKWKRETVAEVERESEELDRLRELFSQQQEALSIGLQHELRTAQSQAQAARKALLQVQQAEADVKNRVAQLEEKLRIQQSALDATLAQFESMKVKVQQAKAQAALKAATALTSPRLRSEGSELKRTLVQVDQCLFEKKQVQGDMKMVTSQLRELESVLSRQRRHSLQIEELFRRFTSGGGRYVLDSLHKKEAQRLLAAAKRLRPPGTEGEGRFSFSEASW